jgi:Ca2+-binding EF-hand superfamily protein
VRDVLCGAVGLLLLAGAVGCAGSGGKTKPEPKPAAEASGAAVRGPSPDADVTEAERAEDVEGFAAFDRDGDGMISAEEYRNTTAHAFHELDANNDDQIAGSEIEAFPPDVRRELDPNGNDAISREEFLDHALRSFQVCDEDGDGATSFAEANSCPERRGKAP